jgi:hypothetical protein
MATEHDDDHPGRPARPHRPGGAVVTVLVWLVVVALAGLALVRLVPFDGATPFAQVVGMTPWALLAGVVVLLLVLLLRRWAAGLVALLATVGLAVVVLPFYGSVPPLGPLAAGPGSGAQTATVMTVNALYGRVDADRLVAEVRDRDVTVLAVVELNGGLVDRLHDAGLDELLPYRTLARTDDATGNRGGGLWSATAQSDPDEGPAGRSFAMPSATVRVGATPVRVTVVHTVPPTLGSVSVWQSDLESVRERAEADPTRQLLLGDYNATYDHASFRRTLGDRFRDANRQWGRGLLPTWPSGRSVPPLMALDHVVVEHGTTVVDLDTVTLPGTDHRALIAALTFPAPVS